ncbi:MAG: hypothetical protein KKB31_05145, partial [Nanoarchaeota archaeon]|nr:hypothetical protein [Nanoarchaeota archaeon]
MDKRGKIAVVSVLLILSLVFILSFVGGDSGKSQVKQIKDYDGNLVNEGESFLWKRDSGSETYKNSDGTMTKILGGSYIDDKSRRFPVYKKLTDVVSMNQTEEGYLISWYDKEVEVKLKVKEKNKDSTELKDFKTEKLNIKEDKILEDLKGNYHFYWELEDTDAKNSGKVSNTKFKDIESFEITVQNTNKDKHSDKQNSSIKQEGIKFILDDGIVINLGDLIENNFTLEKTSDNSVKISPNKTAGKTLDVSKISLDPTITLQNNETENILDGELDYSFAGGSYGEGFFKFNLSSIQNQKVLNSSFNIYVPSIPTNFSGNLSIFRVNNQTWNSTNFNVSIMNSASMNRTNLTGIASAVGWIQFNDTITALLNQELNSGNEFITFRICNSGSDICLNTFGNFASNGATIQLGDGRSEPEQTDAISVASGEYSTDVTKKPYLNITYEPKINILSPTPNQIFTQDSPTAYLNISTSTNMSTCYFNNGTNNYTMSSVNSTYFYNDTAGDILLDGSHTLTFWCNQSSDGTWVQSDSVSFDV